MNVTTTSSAPAPAPPPKAGGPAARTRAQGDTEQDAGTGIAFLSMLQALADPGAQPDPSEPARVLVQDAPMTDTLQTALPTTTVPAEEAHTLRSGDGALAPAVHVPGQRMAQGHDASDANSAKKLQARAVGDEGDVQATTDAAAKSNLASRKSFGGTQDSNDLTQPIARATAEASDKAQARADQVRAVKEPDVSLLRPLVPSQAGASVVSMFEAGLAGLRATPGARGVERGQDRHAASHAAAGFVGWTDAAPTGMSHQTASPVYAPTASTPAPAAALAQRMHYWVAGGVQSAELQLDSFGGGSVDVRIAVKGDEAMVAFRSDQPQARQLLLDAMPQLKELLAGEGLVLSGGFVGGSAQQHANGQGSSREPSVTGVRAGGRPDVRAPAPVSAAVRASPGGAVDLFV